MELISNAFRSKNHSILSIYIVYMYAIYIGLMRIGTTDGG